MLEREQYYIDILNPRYNVCKIAGSTKGRIFTKDHKRRLSESLKGKIRTQEQKEHQRRIKTGKKHKDETKIKLLNYLNEIKGNRIGDKITKEQIVNFSAIFNEQFSYKTLKQICRENNFNYRSILKFVNGSTFREYFYLLDEALLRDIKNCSKTKLKLQNGL